VKEPLPLKDGVKLLRNWFAQRERRCIELGYMEDARRYAGYWTIVRRLAEEAGIKDV
jgi:hypothetical protein